MPTGQEKRSPISPRQTLRTTVVLAFDPPSRHDQTPANARRKRLSLTTCVYVHPHSFCEQPLRVCSRTPPKDPTYADASSNPWSFHSTRCVIVNTGISREKARMPGTMNRSLCTTSTGPSRKDTSNQLTDIFKARSDLTEAEVMLFLLKFV